MHYILTYRMLNFVWHSFFFLPFFLEEIEPRSTGRALTEAKISRGRETLRLRTKGPATVEEMVWLF